MSGNRPLVKIIEAHQKRQDKDIPGAKQYLKYLLDTTLQLTNDHLDQENMHDFKYYKDNKERYPDEFKYVFSLFEENLRELQENSISKILSDLFGGD